MSGGENDSGSDCKWVQVGKASNENVTEQGHGRW